MSDLIERISCDAKSGACGASVALKNEQAPLFNSGKQTTYIKSGACGALLLPSMGTDSIPGECYIEQSATSATFGASQVVKYISDNELGGKNGVLPSATPSATFREDLFKWSAQHNPDHLKMLEAIAASTSEEFTLRCAGQIFRRRAAVDLPWLWQTLGIETPAVMELCEHITPGDKRVCGIWPPGGGLRHHWREWINDLAAAGEIPAPELPTHHAIKARRRMALQADAALGLGNFVKR